MTPEEADNFFEEDEDPAEVFAWFSKGVHGVTARPEEDGVRAHAFVYDGIGDPDSCVYTELNGIRCGSPLGDHVLTRVSKEGRSK